MSELKIRRYHPGIYIKQSIDALGMSNREFSFRSGISERTLSDLISGNGSITFAIASNLANFFHTSINLWTNMQNGYDEYVAASKNQEEVKEDYALLKPFKKYLLNNCLIGEEDDPEEVVQKVRKELSINRISSLCNDTLIVAYKEQNIINKNNDVFAQNFWMTYALTKARENDCATFNKNKLLLSIPELKSLTVKEPNYFLNRIKTILSDCGVSFVCVPYLNKSNIYGATKWLPNGKVVLAISNRSGRADMFWFTFFHELAHVLLEHKRYYLLQGDNIEDRIADKLATDLLIAPDKWNTFVSKERINDNDILAFAKEEKVLPMIIVGRLEKEKKLDYGPTHKRFYKEYAF